jgi:hypothetical protein
MNEGLHRPNLDAFEALTGRFCLHPQGSRFERCGGAPQRLNELSGLAFKRGRSAKRLGTGVHSSAHRIAIDLGVTRVAFDLPLSVS